MTDVGNSRLTSILSEIRELYEVHNFRNAIEILSASCTGEFIDILNALSEFRIELDDIRKPGGNESTIPKKISSLLRAKNWSETRIQGDLVITKTSASSGKKLSQKDANETLDLSILKNKGYQVEQITRKNFLDGHKVDYVKNRVAFDLEWNSKDQTFDRDLYAFRAFYDCDLIDAAVLLTRSKNLNKVFEMLGPELNEKGEPVMVKGKPKLVKSKYGASTTWMGKLLYRVRAGRNGGCPLLVLGITSRIISDWAENNE